MMDKTAIKSFAIEARKILMNTAIAEAGFYGITKNGCKNPIQTGPDFEVYETLAGTENRIFGTDIKRRENLVKAIKDQGFEQVIEETAYTWFNRIIAIRFMEVNNYLPSRVRVLSSETGSSTPDIITQADTVELSLSQEELETIQVAKRENRYDDAFGILFVKQCNELNDILPGLFEKTDDYMELLLKISYTSDGVIRMLVDSIPEDYFNVETEGQVEIIGWMYQYYNTELKDDTFAKLKKNVKISKERIPAATQLFTPDWIVRYMVENSLGRVWIEHLRAVDPYMDEKAKVEEFGWKYYLPESEQEDNVAAELVKVRELYKDLTPQDITCIDPSMGSGHILVYMFDVLMDIYRSEGFSEREAVFDILEKNICGLDIDRRAYQLSYFALMMKARGYNRIFFRGHEDMSGKRVQGVPRVYAIEESNTIDRSLLSSFGSGLDEVQKNKAYSQIIGLLDAFIDAKEYGSIIKVDKYDWELIRKYMRCKNDEVQVTIFSYLAESVQKDVLKLVDIGEVLAGEYFSVITNPPYMGGSGMGQKLTRFVKDNYFDSKADLFACFIEKGLEMLNIRGFNCMVTMQSWMYLSSFEKMRKKAITCNTLCDVLHMDNMVMGIAFGTAVSNMRKGHLVGYKGIYNQVKLSDVSDSGEVLFPNYNNRYGNISTDKFDVIPGMPIAYWFSERDFELFEKEKRFSDFADTKSGLSTTDNNRFLRTWSEVGIDRIGFNYKTLQETKDCKFRYIPHQKGGAYRKWYGNLEYVVDWYNDGAAIKKAAEGASGGRIVGSEYYLREGLTWTDLTSTGKISVRFANAGSIFNSSGPMCFCHSEDDQWIVLGYMNSVVANAFLKLLAPTFHFNGGPIGKLPFVELDENNRRRVNELVRECIAISKKDWDSFESSWDFKRHPFIESIFEHKEIFSDCDDIDIADCYELWEKECTERFEALKKNEIELNEIFINAYKLNGEYDSGVEDKDVTVRKADLGRDIRSLISYAVGCMFGRYSLTEPGLIFAGGEWPPHTIALGTRDRNSYDADMDVCSWTDLYGEYLPDVDGIIPITDEANFSDDIVERFEEFVRKVFGNKSFDNNMEFITNALEVKGTSYKDKIQNYFLNEFYKDHCNAYTVTGSGKRPIYWLFDSGKQNGFKCLIYLHRYSPDTVGLIRSDYLTKAQSMIENALKNAEYVIQTTSSAVDKAQATKKRDKYIKQLAEIKDYYPALSHIALQRIDLNLDDGVKVNYSKFQGIEVSIEGEKKRTVDLLAKI